MRKKRASLSLAERALFERRIYENVISHPLYEEAEEIYCYVSFQDEVSTEMLLEHAWKIGKKVAVPKIIVDNFGKYMEFFYIDSREELSIGYYGILEPESEKKAEGRKVLVIMPGMAFDTNLNRIGYGGGFYDAYLEKHMEYRRMAIAFSVQCVEKIPAEPYDIRPEVLITEEGAKNLMKRFNQRFPDYESASAPEMSID